MYRSVADGNGRASKCCLDKTDGLESIGILFNVVDLLDLLALLFS